MIAHKIILLLWVINLPACDLGTEVGNGVRAKKDSSAPISTGGSPESSATDSSNAPTGSGEKASPDSSPVLKDSDHLRVPCATPFGEAKPGVWTSSKGSRIELELSQTGKNLKLEGLTYTLTRSTMTSPDYVATISPNEIDLGCSQVESETMAGITSRKVSFSNQRILIWQIEAGELVSISLQTPSGEMLETWIKL